MLTLIVYLLGVIISFRQAYRSLGEEMCETYPTLEPKDKIFVVSMAAIMSLYSWLTVLIFSNRHKSFIKN